MAQEGVETQEVVTQESLVDSFKWDLEDDGIFTPPVVETKEERQKRVLAEVKSEETEEVIETKPPKVKKNGTEQQPESEHSFFEDPETEGSENSESEGSKDTKGKNTGSGTNAKDVIPPEEEPDIFFKTLATEMKEKGIFTSLEIKEDDEIDEERFLELQEEEIQARVDETFVNMFEELNNDPDAVAFLKFKKQGGNTYDFFRTYGQSNTLPDNMDLADKASQEKVLKYYYLTIEELDEADLEEKLEWVTEKGKTEELAKKYYKKINDQDRANKLELIKKQELAVENAKKQSEKLRSELQAVLDKGEGEKDFKFNPEDKKELISFITKPTIKAVNNRYITPFQAKIGEIMQDRKKMLTLAKIIIKDFDLPDLKKIVTTQVTKETKNKLRDAKETSRTGRSTMTAEKSLADLFN